MRSLEICDSLRNKTDWKTFKIKKLIFSEIVLPKLTHKFLIVKQTGLLKI